MNVPNIDSEADAKVTIGLLTANCIPERYHNMMRSIILFAAKHPEQTLTDACDHYAEMHQTSGEAVYRTFRHAVYSGWEQAESPSSVLYQNRMSPEEFAAYLLSQLNP